MVKLIINIIIGNLLNSFKKTVLIKFGNVESRVEKNRYDRKNYPTTISVILVHIVIL